MLDRQGEQLSVSAPMSRQSQFFSGHGRYEVSLSHVVWCFLSSNLVLLFCQKTVEDFIPIETLFNQNFSKQIIKKQTYKKRKETNNKQKCKKQVSRLKKKRTKDKKFSRGVIMSDVTHRKALRELQKKLRVEIWEKGLKLEIDSNSFLFLLVKKKKNETQTYGP